ncbi:unnamed protein product [Ectocarpus sp. 8 AP-2014]
MLPIFCPHLPQRHILRRQREVFHRAVLRTQRRLPLPRKQERLRPLPKRLAPHDPEPGRVVVPVPVPGGKAVGEASARRARRAGDELQVDYYLLLLLRCSSCCCFRLIRGSGGHAARAYFVGRWLILILILILLLLIPLRFLVDVALALAAAGAGGGRRGGRLRVVERVSRQWTQQLLLTYDICCWSSSARRRCLSLLASAIRALFRHLGRKPSGTHERSRTFCSSRQRSKCSTKSRGQTTTTLSLFPS